MRHNSLARIAATALLIGLFSVGPNALANHIASDGRGGYIMSNGSHVSSDGRGGYIMPNGSHVSSDGTGGYFTP